MMKSWRKWVLWLPVVISFALVVTIAGFGFEQVTSNPGALAFAALMTFVGLIQGLIVGLIAVLGARLADRIWQKVGAQRDSLERVVLVHAVVVGGLVGVAVLIYLNLIPSRTDHPSIALPVLVVTLVAGASGALSAWGRRRITDA